MCNTQWVLASNNQGKIKEINSLLNKLNINIKPQEYYNIPEADETATTFVENALIKARNACNYSKLPSLADDSGLVVPCLNGEPGIYSARYSTSGKSIDNIYKLINSLKSLAQKTPNLFSSFPAYFYCVITLLKYPEDPTPIITEGIWHGEIILNPRGKNGFGYDPIFLDNNLNLTAAEMTSEQKKAISHRGQALSKLINKLHN